MPRAAAEGDWACANCTLMNKPRSTHAASAKGLFLEGVGKKCGACQTVKGTPAKGAPVKRAKTAKTDTEWTCSSCTFVNPRGRNCGMCRTAKGTPAKGTPAPVRRGPLARSMPSHGTRSQVRDFGLGASQARDFGCSQSIGTVLLRNDDSQALGSQNFGSVLLRNDDSLAQANLAREASFFSRMSRWSTWPLGR